MSCTACRTFVVGVTLTYSTQHKLPDPEITANQYNYLQAGHVGQGRSQDLVSHIVIVQLQLSVAAESSSESLQALSWITADLHIVLSSSNSALFIRSVEGNGMCGYST